MNIHQRIIEIKDLEDVSDKVMNTIARVGFVTGSSAWGVNTRESDIDVVIPPNASISFDSIMRSDKGVYLHKDEKDEMHYIEEQTQNLYIFKNKKIYNLIFAKTEKVFEEWVFATKEMKAKLSDPFFKEQIKNKNYRVYYFIELREEFKRG